MPPADPAAETLGPLDETAGRPAPRAVRIAARLALAGVLGFFVVHAGRMIHAQLPDFEYFYRAGRALLDHGSLDPGWDRFADGTITRRGTLDWYLPFTHRLMTLLAWMPFEAAGYAWLALNVAATLATLSLLGRIVESPRGDWPVTQLLPFLLLAAYWAREYRQNQVNNLTLLLIVAGFALWLRGRRASAGFWLGLAVLVKVTPLLLLVWFALKRQVRTVAVAVATVAFAGPASDLLIFGPSRTLDAYVNWVNHAVRDGSHAGLILAGRERDWRNQGLGAVLDRWLTPVSWATHFDNDPRLVKFDATPRYINVADWPAAHVALLTNALLAASLLALLWLARRPADRLDPWRLRYEWALFTLAMLWFMPVMRQYHVIWATPALSLLGPGLRRFGPRHPWSAAALLAVAAVVAAQFGLIKSWLWVQAAGVTLASVLVLALPLVAMLILLDRQSRRSRAPAPQSRRTRTAQPNPHPAGGPT